MDLELIKQEYPEIPVGTRATNLTGQKINDWKIFYRTINNNQNKVMQVCECQLCGKIKPVKGTDITSERSKNCGCKREIIKIQKRDAAIRKRDSQGNIVEKHCSKCDNWLPLESFYKNKTTKDGYANICKDCSSPKNNIERYIHQYKNNAQRRNINFNLTNEEFISIISQPCYYCGIKPTKDKLIGIDRIDSSKDYIIENCVPCCEMCNKMKLNYSVSDWLNHMKKIISFMENKNE